VPGSDEEKSGHGVQSVSSDADDSVSRKWSAGQSTHADCPSCVWILPAGQAAHAAAAGELLAVPAGHRAHALKSAALLYWPVGQATHACAESGADPAGHPAGPHAPPDPGTSPAGHARHTSCCGSRPANMLALRALICAVLRRASTA